MTQNPENSRHTAPIEWQLATENHGFSANDWGNVIIALHADRFEKNSDYRNGITVQIKGEVAFAIMQEEKICILSSNFSPAINYLKTRSTLVKYALRNHFFIKIFQSGVSSDKPRFFVELNPQQSTSPRKRKKI